MKKIWYSIPFFMLFACGQNDLYRSTIKSADSLSGAVSFIMNELRSPDSLEISRYQKVYSYYNQFILQNVNDTVNKIQADALQSFFSAGRELDYFQTNRSKLSLRGAQINEQLKTLSHDLEEKSIPAQEGLGYLANEKKTAQELITTAQSSKKNVLVAIQNLKNSVREVENIIRSRNNGDLPTIVKDSLAF